MTSVWWEKLIFTGTYILSIKWVYTCKRGWRRAENFLLGPDFLLLQGFPDSDIARDVASTTHCARHRVVLVVYKRQSYNNQSVIIFLSSFFLRTKFDVSLKWMMHRGVFWGSKRSCTVLFNVHVLARFKKGVACTAPILSYILKNR